MTYDTYEQGANDARVDLSEGWVPEFITASAIRNQLEKMVGATEEYIQGYLSVLGEWWVKGLSRT